MRNLKMPTPAEVRRAGWETLREKSGPAAALRFMLDYEKDEGNYTELRREIFKGKRDQDIVNDMK